MKKKWLLPIFASFMLFTAVEGEIETAEAATAQDVISTSNKYLGIPYRWGGTTTAGFDCSGFTQRVFSELGVNIGRDTYAQYAKGYSVSKNNLQVGDLVFFNTAGGISHVGIYTGNGQFVNSSTSKGVSYASINDPYYWGSRYIGAKRVMSLDSAQKEQVKEATIDFSVIASRGEVAKKLAEALQLDTSDTTTSFVDVKATNDYAGAIAAVERAGIFKGADDGKFNPASPITRGQLATVLVRAFELQQQGEGVAFSDVTDKNDPTGAISVLASNGITTGKDDGSFGIVDQVTNKHLAVFIERALN